MTSLQPQKRPARPEILAPAGDRAALEAAVRAGADAVYFGLQAFNARARATNFDDAGLADTFAFLHAHGVRGYVTLNTLIFDGELAAAERAVRACAEAGADAVIVQDLGLVRLARAVAPSLPVHASTQMTCTDAGSVELARALGASRVILARELSLADLRQIRAGTDAELEVFVHGALCISYSGQCLTSEAIGGRSANRGACAQACRLPYELVVDGVLRELGDQAYLLSPEDLEATRAVEELVALGISSLKIEGRLKGPEYVAATTRLYRAAVDAALGEGPGPDEALRQTALQTYSRGSGLGFFGGVDHQRLVEGRGCDHRGTRLGTLAAVRRAGGRAQLALSLSAPLRRGDGLLVEGGREGRGEHGGRVWSVTVDGHEVDEAPAGAVALAWLGPERDGAPDALVGHRVWKTSSPATLEAVREEIDRDPARERLDLTLSGALGEAPRLHGRTAYGLEAAVTLDVALQPGGAPPPRAVLDEKLGRLGDSPFRLGTLTVELPADGLLPVSALNRARRALVAALLEAARARRHPTTDVTAAALLAATRPPASAPLPAGLVLLCRTEAQAEAALAAGADGVVLDFLELTGTGRSFRALRERFPSAWLAVAPPRIRKPGEEKIDRYLHGLEPDAVYVRGLGALGEGAQPGAPTRIGDFSLNVTNRLTAAEVLGRGCAAFTPAFDLDGAQLVTLLGDDLAPFAEVVVHHPMPLFHMEHCVIAALLSDGKDHLSCGRPCERHQISLRDRAGMDHPVEADVGCRNTVFHAAAQSAASLVPRLRAAGVRRFRVELVRQGADEVGKLVAAYRALLEGRRAPDEVWRALKAESSFGVVRGSLRILSEEASR